MKLIDMDKLGNPAAWHNRHVYFAEQIRMLPAVDAVPVVRCGECKFRADFTDGHSECRRWPNVPMSYQRVDQLYDFCSYGERKGGAE